MASTRGSPWPAPPIRRAASTRMRRAAGPGSVHHARESASHRSLTWPLLVVEASAGLGHPPTSNSQRLPAQEHTVAEVAPRVPTLAERGEVGVVFGRPGELVRVANSDAAASPPARVAAAERAVAKREAGRAVV